MPDSSVRIRVRTGANEIEIEGPLSAAKDAIALIKDIMESMPPEAKLLQRTASEHPLEMPSLPRAPSQPIQRTGFPEIKVEKDDSLMDVVTKIFKDQWGRQPRKLSEVREALESYGMIYPKQSVAVALLRLAQSGKLRRFKGEGKEFVYTASTVLAAEAEPDVVEKNIELESVSVKG